MGPPGSGKGTLASICIKEFGWEQISTGNLCRNHIQRNTDIGNSIKSILDSGKLVSDEIIVSMIKEWLSLNKDFSKNIIFDGFPRTKKQAELLYQLLKDLGKDSQLMLIKFQVDNDVLVDRIVSRVICSNKDCQQVYSLSQNSFKKSCDFCDSILYKRDDDTKDKLMNRIDLYYQNEKSIIDFFVSKGVIAQVINIDGQKSMQDVFTDFSKLIERK